MIKNNEIIKKKSEGKKIGGREKEFIRTNEGKLFLEGLYRNP